MFPGNAELPTPELLETSEPTAAEVVAAGDGDHSTCIVVREILDRVGDKWSVLVISLLGDRGHRFTELRKAIDGISQRMLTLTLRQLERDGLVSRTVHATVPPRVDYALTPLGQSVLEPILALTSWAAAHGTDIADARARYDAEQLETEATG
jgi:DNA-binding HxlR family transcriptional regulator